MLATFLMEHFSYGVLFVWSIFEGEIGLTLAGYMSKKEIFEFQRVVMVASVGAFIGDTVLYLSGRFIDRKNFAFLQQNEEQMHKIAKWFGNNAVLLILFERFVYGTHIPSLLFIGMSGFSFVKFLIVDMVGVVLWALVFTSLGYYFGESVVDMIVLLQRHLSVLFLLFLFALIVYVQRKNDINR